MSNETTQTKRPPAYRIFSVTQPAEGSDAKATWTEIGAAWKHRDGKGLNLKFTTPPVPGTDTVLRVPSAKKGAA